MAGETPPQDAAQSFPGLKRQRFLYACPEGLVLSKGFGLTPFSLPNASNSLNNLLISFIFLTENRKLKTENRITGLRAKSLDKKV
jgi:hypothetical protein